MTKQSIIYFLLTIAMTVYLTVAIKASNRMSDEAPCRGVTYNLTEPSSFVTEDDINRELGYFKEGAEKKTMGEISLGEIEKRLEQLPIVEDAVCYRLSDDVINIDVTPMIPVARIFEQDKSYYINKAGKKLAANSSYHIDVPVVMGYFDKGVTPMDLVPLITNISSSAAKQQLVSAVKVDSNGDIILIPSLVGHVINFGDVSGIENKFSRIMAFYRDVLPVKGWNYYDTISVKFSGQVIGKIAGKVRKTPVFEYSNEDYRENVDTETMTVNPDILPELKQKI